MLLETFSIIIPIASLYGIMFSVCMVFCLMCFLSLCAQDK